jgi:RNAse (barnase) inhibitor barstar
MLRAVTSVYVLDGTQVRTLEDFWRVIGEAINGPGGYFGRNLDAFADCLSGGFGTPDDDDYVVEWRDHATSREYLSHAETARQLELRLSRCHPTNRPAVSADLVAARGGHGKTVFDWLVEILEDRAPGVLRLQ